MRKHGLTLVELLGAIVIFSIVASLSAIMISTITKSNAKIVEQSRANTESTLLTVYLDRQIRDFSATNFQACSNPTNCMTLIKAFDYVPHLESGTINLVVYNPAQQLQIALINHELIVGSNTYNLAHFSLDASSSITYTATTEQVNYHIHLIFIGQHSTYEYNYHKTLTRENIPIG